MMGEFTQLVIKAGLGYKFGASGGSGLDSPQQKEKRVEVLAKQIAKENGLIPPKVGVLNG